MHSVCVIAFATVPSRQLMRSTPRPRVVGGALSLNAMAPDVTAEVDPVETTLELLEWQRLSNQVASLTSTQAARDVVETSGLRVDHSLEASERLHRELEEVWTLECKLARPLPLQGFCDLAPLVRHTTKGGVLDGVDLVAISESLAVATKLMKALKAAATDGDEDGSQIPVRLPLF